MTQEDWDLYNDLDCSTGEHALARVGYHDILVEYVNYIAAGERHRQVFIFGALCSVFSTTQRAMSIRGTTRGWSSMYPSGNMLDPGTDHSNVV